MKEKVEKKGDTGIKPTHSGIKQTHIHEIHYSIYVEIRYSVCMCTIIIALWRSMELPLHKIQRDLRDTKKEAINNCYKLSVVRSLMPLLTYPMTLTRPIGRYNSSTRVTASSSSSSRLFTIHVVLVGAKKIALFFS